MTAVIVGVVLAGGRSSRFGREKAVADVGGLPIIAHVMKALSSGCECVAVNARLGSLAAGFAVAEGMTCLPDAPGDPDGPLSGIKAGLIWAQSRGATALATAPCDTPFLPLDLVERLATVGEGNAAVAQTAAGLQPLCAVWPVSALEGLCTALSAGAHPAIRDVLFDLKAARVMFAQETLFDNLNTPDEYRAARLRVADTNR